MSKISDLPAIDPLTIDGSETLPVVKGEATGRATLAQLAGATARKATLPWVDYDAALVGGDWSPAMLEVARAIKSVHYEGPGVGAADRFYISQFHNDNGGSGDRILIRRVSDNANVGDSGTAAIAKNADGATVVTFTYMGQGVPGASIFWRFEIDYSQIATTGELVNLANGSPLVIDRAHVVATVRRNYLRADAPSASLKNRAVNPALDPALPLPGYTASSPVLAPPLTTELAAFGVLRTRKAGAGGAPGYTIEAILQPEDWGKRFIGGFYVESSDGTFGSTFAIKLAIFGAGVGSLQVHNLGYVPITPNLRWYFAAGTIPANADEVRFGSNDLTGGAPDLRFGGRFFFIDDKPLSLFDVPRNRWYDGDLEPAKVAAATRATARRFQGEAWACCGDSILANYGIPAALATATGAAVENTSFGGTTLAAVAAPDGLQLYKQHFTFAALAPAIAAKVAGTGNFETQAQAADDMVAAGQAAGSNNDYRARVVAMQALDWSTLDRLLVAYGTNDYNSGIAIGPEGSTDPLTLTGALNSALDTLQAALPELDIAVIPPLWRFNAPANVETPEQDQTADQKDGYTSANAAGLTLRPYQDAIEAAAQARNVPVIPLHRLFGVNRSNWSTFHGDGLHLLPAGVARWVVRSTSWMTGNL